MTHAAGLYQYLYGAPLNKKKINMLIQNIETKMFNKNVETKITI